MKQLLFFFSFFGLQLTGFGQEQITDFDKFSYDYEWQWLGYIHEDSSFMYFSHGDTGEIKKFDLTKDTLVFSMALPKQESQYSFFVVNGEAYARHFTDNSSQFYYLDFKQDTFRKVGSFEIGFFYLFNTETGAYFINEGNLMKMGFDKSSPIVVDTLYTSVVQDHQLGNYTTHTYFQGIERNTKDTVKVVLDNKTGKFHNLSFPEFENKTISSVMLLDEESMIISCRESNNSFYEQYYLEDNELVRFPNREVSIPEVKYFSSDNRMFEVYYLNQGKKKTEVVINEILGGKRIEKARHIINVFKTYYSVVYMGPPSEFSYGDDILYDDNFYFLGNDDIRDGSLNGESNFKLFKINIDNGDLTVIDANILLNKDLYSRSWSIGGGGFKLEPAMQGLTIYPIVASNRFLHKTYTFSPKTSSFSELNTHYDPRSFVKTRNGYYSGANFMLLDRDKNFVAQIVTRKVVKTPKSESPYEEVYFGKIFKTEKVLYMTHLENGKVHLSTFDGISGVKHHTEFDRFLNIDKIETINCPLNNKQVVAIYGLQDTLAVNGLFLFVYDLETREMTFLDRSFRLESTNKPAVVEIAGEVEIHSNNYYFKTNFTEGKLIDRIHLLHVLPNGELLTQRDDKLLIMNVSDNRITELSVDVKSSIYLQEKLYYLGKNGLEKMVGGKIETIFKGSQSLRTTLSTVSDSELFYILNDTPFIYNVMTGENKRLDFLVQIGRYYFNAYKVKDILYIDEWDSPGRNLIKYDLKGNTHSYLSLKTPVTYLYDKLSQKLQTVTEEYRFIGYGEANLTYIFSDVIGGTIKETLRIKSKNNLYFSDLESSYYTAYPSGKIYYFSSTDYSLRDWNNVLLEYEEVRTILRKGEVSDELLVKPKNNSGTYDILKLDKIQGKLEVVKRNIPKTTTPLAIENGYSLVDTLSSDLKVFYFKNDKTSEQFRHNTVSGITRYTHFFAFKNNTFSIAHTDSKGFQLYKLTDEEIVDNPEIILSNENPAIDFSFYPNPTSDFLTLNATVKSSEKYTIRVFSTDGKLLRELQSTLPQNIDFSGLKTGVYLINVTNSKENRTFRMIKN